MTTKSEEKVKAEEPQYVTKAEFDKMTDILSTMSSILIELKNRPVGAPAVESKEDVEIKKAKPDEFPMPPSWEEKAQEILGELLDHVELMQPKGGGTLFTVVIKDEFSNASQEYKQRMKQDRRTKDVSATGIGGVEEWCRLIRSNLKRFQQK